jgi:hypothetical protein
VDPLKRLWRVLLAPGSQREQAEPPAPPYRPAGIILVLLLCVAHLLPAQEQTLEFRVKAAFLLNFTKFVEWPAPDAQNPAPSFALCIAGEDPFGPALGEIVEGETVNGRKIVIRHIRGDASASCSLLYVSKEEKNVPGILASAGYGVLTVGEGDAFLDEGGMIGFVLENKRVRFNIDLAAAQREGLKLSSRLLSVARLVR